MRCRSPCTCFFRASYKGEGERDASYSVPISWVHLQLRDGGKFFEFSAEESFVRLQRYAEGALRDDMLIPLFVDRDELIGNLFDPAVLQDPENAPPELDDSWRFANLMDVVRVKWERY